MKNNKDYNAIVFGLCIAAALLLLVGILINHAIRAQPQIDLQAIATIESNNNPQAVGAAGEVGLYQIMPIVRKSYNKRTGQSYTRQALFDPAINRKIASWYLHQRIPEMLRHYEKPVTAENILWAYNAGIGNLVDGIKPEITERYIARYFNLVNSD